MCRVYRSNRLLLVDAPAAAPRWQQEAQSISDTAFAQGLIIKACMPAHKKGAGHGKPDASSGAKG